MWIFFKLVCFLFLLVRLFLFWPSLGTGVWILLIRPNRASCSLPESHLDYQCGWQMTAFVLRSLLYLIGQCSVVFAVLCWHALSLLEEKLYVTRGHLLSVRWDLYEPVFSMLCPEQWPHILLSFEGERKGWWVVFGHFPLKKSYPVESKIEEYVCLAFKLRWDDPSQECCRGDSSLR